MRAAELDPATLYRCVAGRLYKEEEFELFVDDIFSIWACFPDLSDMQEELTRMWENATIVEIKERR